MDEVWRTVPDFDRYEVSDQGRCARIVTRGGREARRLMTGRIEGNGYVTFHFYGADGKQKHPLAHRVVWRAFRGPIPAGFEINHKNGIKADNRLENFELATRSENMLHGFRELGFSRNRLKGAIHPKARLWEDDVMKVLELRRSGVRRHLVAKQFNVSSTAIHLIETGHNWGHLTGLPISKNSPFPAVSSRGSLNAMAKLTETDIPKIFEMRRAGRGQRDIANHFEISLGQVQRVLNRERWGHVAVD